MGHSCGHRRCWLDRCLLGADKICRTCSISGIIDYIVPLERCLFVCYSYATCTTHYTHVTTATVTTTTSMLLPLRATAITSSTQNNTTATSNTNVSDTNKYSWYDDDCHRFCCLSCRISSCIITTTIIALSLTTAYYYYSTQATTSYCVLPCTDLHPPTHTHAHVH